MMKLHFHPLSPASQPLLLFCADASIAYEPVVVDIMTGEHHQERFIALNPNALVPVRPLSQRGSLDDLFEVAPNLAKGPRTVERARRVASLKGVRLNQLTA